MTGVRIGVVGDLHTHWDAWDVAYFERTDFELLVFIGDLGGGSRDSSLRVARSLSRLDRPTLVMPGNNDTGDIGELAAELAHRGGIRQLAAVRRGDADARGRAPPLVTLCGYSSHHLGANDAAVTLIAGRPHSMGGPDLAFAEHMRDAWGVATMAESTARLLVLVDRATTRDILFVAHNGPTGLGAAPTDMWGCDFRPGGGDWGDPDLAAAIVHARATGHRVLGVIAGHMHLRTKAGEERPWQTTRDGVLYVNAARVPRIFAADDAGATDVHRHHLAVTLTPETLEVAEVLVTQSEGQSIVSSSAAIRRADTP